MKKVLKILLYFSVILFIVILFVSKESIKQDEQTKVTKEQEHNISNRIEKAKEIEKETNQKLMVSAKDEQNITENVGYWKLVKVEIYGRSIAYEYNNNKQIIKRMIDDKEGKTYSVTRYGYDEKGRETFSSVYYNNIRREDNISREFTDDGKLKEKSITHSIDGEVYSFTKIIYSEKGDTLKEIGKRGEVSYEKEYHYSDTKQLLEIVLVSKDKRFIFTKYEYEGERLVSKRFFQEGEAASGEDYIYEDGVLKEVYHFEEAWTSHKFYNEIGLVKEKVDFGKKTKYLYDEQNRLVTQETDTMKNDIFYNDDGEKIREEYYEKDSDGEFEQVSYTLFDEEKTKKVLLNSNRVEITYKNLYLENVLIEKRRDVYDEHGNLIEIWDDASDKLIEKRFYRFVIEEKQ